MDLQNTALGIEFGSTRIKAVLIDSDHRVLAVGSHTWQNELVDGVWTYSYEAILAGLQDAYAELKRAVEERFSQNLTSVGAIGISAMMHGYLPLDAAGRPLTAFRTWRNTMTSQASEVLTEAFSFRIPQRWTIAHLYQAILNGEEHVKDIARLTTLAGYIHWRLSGESAVGLGEASGIVPLDQTLLDYDQRMIDRFEAMIACKNYPWTLQQILPRAVPAGQQAGNLTKEGALLLDPSGTLRPGIPLCPCEGDADTGMVATNSVREHTGNVSAGTSAFIMLVADHPLGIHREVDMLCTPSGKPVAMVHSSNCSSDLNAWVEVFYEFAGSLGYDKSKSDLYPLLFRKALEGDKDGGGLLSINYFSGEGVTGFNEGRPVFTRMPNANFTLANFMRTHLLSALSTLKIGCEILSRSEDIPIDRILGHGGLFKTPEVAQRILSAALGVPVSVMETAGEGGAYGMALLAAFMLWKGEGETLPDYLDNKVFADVKITTLMADEEDIAGFDRYIERYLKALPLESSAIDVLS